MSLYAIYRSLVDWWNPYPEEGLDLYYQQEIHHRYNDETIITRMPSYKWYLQQRNVGSIYRSSIAGVYHKQLLPIIDADNEKDMLNASLWLNENKVKHAILGSSQRSSFPPPPPPNEGNNEVWGDQYSNGGFWIIIDRPGKWKDVRKWINIPGQDKNYLRFSEHKNMCYLRAEMKVEYFVPVIIQESRSELVDNFANEVVKHFSSKAVHWLWRLESYKQDRVDLTNPNELDIGLTLDEVLA
jgi:hypothetical protein